MPHVFKGTSNVQGDDAGHFGVIQRLVPGRGDQTLSACLSLSPNCLPLSKRYSSKMFFISREIIDSKTLPVMESKDTLSLTEVS